jgi:hypothetical protein
MSMSALKEKVKSRLVSITESDIEKNLISYENYIRAYCAELKLTEVDILTNEKLFNQTFNLFNHVVLNKELVS